MPIDPNILLRGMQPVPDVTLPSEARRRALVNQQAEMQVQNTKDVRAREQRVRDVLAQSNGDLDAASKALMGIDPQASVNLRELSLRQQQEQRLAGERRERELAGKKADWEKRASRFMQPDIPEPVRKSYQARLVQEAQANGFAAPQTDEDWLQYAPAPDTKPIIVSRGATVLTPKGEVLFQGEPEPPKPEKGPEIGSFGDYVTRFAAELKRPVETLSAKEIEQARKRYNQSDDRPPAAGGGAKDQSADVDAIADAIVAGSQPPDLQRIYGMTGPVRAALARRGYDLTRAQEDWNGTQRYLNTLNGAQQVRLRQAVSFSKDSLPIIEQLAQEWNAGGFRPLNKANLVLAKNGVLGEKAMSIANRLDAQIGDLASELGTVYKGGNSSTDESLKLAAKNLQADWSQKTMMDAINQIRQNLTIRENSIKFGAPVANDGNPYAPKTGAPEPSSAPAGDFMDTGVSGIRIRKKS